MTVKENIIKNKLYTKGLWSKEMIHRLVEIGKLTSEDYLEITGETYTT